MCFNLVLIAILFFHSISVISQETLGPLLDTQLSNVTLSSSQLNSTVREFVTAASNKTQPDLGASVTCSIPTATPSIKQNVVYGNALFLGPTTLCAAGQIPVISQLHFNVEQGSASVQYCRRNMCSTNG